MEKVVKFLACIVENSFARWRQLYTRVPLPLPLTHIGCYHGSTHTDTNFFFEVGRRSNLLPLTPLSAILPPLLLLCFFFTATAAAVLLFLRRPAVSTGSSSSPLHLLLRRCCCWCFFFFSTSSSFLLLLLLLLLCNMGLMIHIYIYIYNIFCIRV